MTNRPKRNRIEQPTDQDYAAFIERFGFDPRAIGNGDYRISDRLACRVWDGGRHNYCRRHVGHTGIHVKHYSGRDRSYLDYWVADPTDEHNREN